MSNKELDREYEREVKRFERLLDGMYVASRAAAGRQAGYKAA